MARADLRKAETEMDRREEIGKAFDRASQPFSLKELSDMLKRDERQLAKWKNGGERVQMDVVLGCAQLWPRMVLALARLRPDVIEEETTLRVRVPLL